MVSRTSAAFGVIGADGDIRAVYEATKTEKH
jgi:hypothetical protein